MDKEMNKDWMDAVRERCLSEGAVPSPDGWSQIGRKMRRAAAWRRSAVAASVLIPIAAILIWAPWHHPSVPSAPVSPTVQEHNSIAWNDSPAVPKSVPVIPSPSYSVVPGPSSPVVQIVPDSAVPSEAKEASEPQPGSDAIQDILPVESETDVKPKAAEKSPAVYTDPFETFPEPSTGYRPRISVGFRAGSGTERRNTGVTLQSSPYIAALTYMNSFESPDVARVKSNYANSVGYGTEANLFFPKSSTSDYRHDLPISLGVTVRVEVAPRTGVESGIEYTYLHSAVETVIGRLDQQLHFIGIPVRMDTRLLSYGGFDLYSGVGVKMEKCIAASLGQIHCEENRLQWSAETFAGLQYGIWNKAHLFFQPEVSYYITDTDLVTYRTENPFTLTLHAGLRFDL